MDISLTTNEKMPELPWLQNVKILDCAHIKYIAEFLLTNYKKYKYF